ncbi:MAG: NUDIX hydrolase [Candidatus Woesearchaeota archaeon]
MGYGREGTDEGTCGCGCTGKGADKTEGRDRRTPAVGVGVLIRKDGKVLMGRRKNSHGHDTWAPPGGHLEWNETFEDCAKREVLEETGLSIKDVRFLTATNDMMKDDEKHYITLYLVADHERGEPENKEPEKCRGWEWFTWEELPGPLFLPMRNLLDQGLNPFGL